MHLKSTSFKNKYLCALFSFLMVFPFTPMLIGQTDFFRDKTIIPYQTNEGENLDSIYGISNSVENRARSLNFFKTMLEISEPSTISVKTTDYTLNRDKDLQKRPFILNADIQTPIGLGGKRWGKKWLSTVHIIPQFKVRIFDNDPMQGDSSLPVRTPSYMPGITYFGTHKKIWNQPVKEGMGSLFTGLKMFHHSDGQDAPEFYQDGSINTYSGDFGEQLVFEFMIGGIYGWKCNTPKSRKGIKKTPKNGKSFTVRRSERADFDRRLYSKLSYEWHEKTTMTNIAYSEYNLYGRHRLNLQAGVSIIPSFVDLIYSEKEGKFVTVTPTQQKETFRFVLNTSYILDKNYNKGDAANQQKVSFLDVSRRLNVNFTAYWRIRNTPFAGLFVQVGYYGSDPYNVYFQQSMWQWRAGLATSFFKYPKNGDFEE